MFWSIEFSFFTNYFFYSYLSNFLEAQVLDTQPSYYSFQHMHVHCMYCNQNQKKNFVILSLFVYGFLSFVFLCCPKFLNSYSEEQRK